MTRIHVICEGQTEEAFVKEVLQPGFSRKGIFLFPSLIGRPGHKGGNVSFDRAFRDIKLRLSSDRTSYCTTFFDYYGIDTDFPGRAGAQSLWSAEQKSQHVHAEFARHVCAKLQGVADVAGRFIPYIQMYEFEGLLFACPRRFATGIGQPSLQGDLQAIRAAFPHPEAINDSVHTAPSKRVNGLCAGYQKPLHGVLAALEIGAEDLRQECRLFHEWLSRLEALAP